MSHPQTDAASWGSKGSEDHIHIPFLQKCLPNVVWMDLCWCIVSTSSWVLQVPSRGLSPFNSSLVGQMPGLFKGGSFTPSGTPVFRTSKYWESGSLAISAIDRRWSKKNGCPSKGVSRWDPGTSDLTCANRSGGKGLVFVLSVNRFIPCRSINHLSTTLVASPRIFFPKSTSDGAGFLKGGGDLPGLGFPPPSRSGRTLKPRRTITVGSNKACNLETGVVDGRSTTSGAGTPLSVVGYELWPPGEVLIPPWRYVAY